MPRILLVDDEPHVVRVIKLGLSRKGYEVDVANNGVDALSKLRDTRFDVLITDFQMPRMDGRGLCEAIAAEPADRRPLTLVVSGKTDLDVRSWTASAVDVRFLEKPLSLKRLISLLADHFEQLSMPRVAQS